MPAQANGLGHGHDNTREAPTAQRGGPNTRVTRGLDATVVMLSTAVSVLVVLMIAELGSPLRD